MDGVRKLLSEFPDKSSPVAFNKKGMTIALHVNTHVRNKKVGNWEASALC